MQKLKQEVINISDTISTELQELRDFVQYFHLMTITNKVGQTTKSLTFLLELN